jgi:hypothetical protein
MPRYEAHYTNPLDDNYDDDDAGTVKMAIKTVAMMVMIDFNGNEFLLSVRTEDAKRDLWFC